MERHGRAVVILLVIAAVFYWLSAAPSTPTSASPGSFDRDLTFHGYDCTKDCSGHEAGYAWAKENYITAEDDCDGNTKSFIEGCRAYAEEQAAAAKEIDEDEAEWE